MRINWPEVTVNGEKLLSSGDNGVEVTPEYLIEWMKSEKRPEGYVEGNVFIKLTYKDIARLFGNVTVTYSGGDNDS